MTAPKFNCCGGQKGRSNSTAAAQRNGGQNGTQPAEGSSQQAQSKPRAQPAVPQKLQETSVPNGQVSAMPIKPPKEPFQSRVKAASQAKAQFASKTHSYKPTQGMRLTLPPVVEGLEGALTMAPKTYQPIKRHMGSSSIAGSSPAADIDIDNKFQSNLVYSLTSDNFKDFLRDKMKAIVMFYGASCGEAAMHAQNFNSASKHAQNADHVFAAVDCSLQSALCTKQKVGKTPMFKLYNNGQMKAALRDPDPTDREELLDLGKFYPRKVEAQHMF